MAEVEYHREGAIGVIRLNRPQRRNALTREMLAEIARLSRQVSDEEAVRAVVFEAEGSDFSVGADLQDPPSRREGASLLARRRAAAFGAQVVRAVIEIPQPTICAIQGVATGGGACIASACDFRIAAAGARLGYGEVRLGMNLMWNAAGLCLHLVGPSRAKQMIMTGRLFDCSTLERWGFIDQIVEVSGLREAARAMAGEYAALPPNAVQMIKSTLNHLSQALDGSVLHMDADQWVLAAGSGDYREAVNAFFEKRPGRFTGD